MMPDAWKGISCCYLQGACLAYSFLNETRHKHVNGERQVDKNHLECKNKSSKPWLRPSTIFKIKQQFENVSWSIPILFWQLFILFNEMNDYINWILELKNTNRPPIWIQMKCQSIWLCFNWNTMLYVNVSIDYACVESVEEICTPLCFSDMFTDQHRHEILICWCIFCYYLKPCAVLEKMKG